MIQTVPSSFDQEGSKHRFEMGKYLQHQDSTISLENGSPGCIRGIFRHFNNRKWHNVRKRLPHTRHSGGKLAAAVGDSRNNSNAIDAGEVQGKVDAEMSNSTEKSSKPGSAQRNSMKSRIKALMTDELSKRKVRHHRSSSYPERIQLERTPSIHHLKDSNPDPCAKTSLNDETLDHQDNLRSLVSSLLDPLLPNISAESIRTSHTCDLCAAMLSMNYLRQNEVSGLGKQPVKDHTLLQDSSIYAIEPSKNASLQESKLFLDALDLLNMRKELFLKVLQDPNSSLSHHLHGHKASTVRLGLTKSVSFPVAHSSNRRDTMKNKQEIGSSTEGEHKLQVRIKDQNFTLFTASEELNRHSEIPRRKSEGNEAPRQLLLRDEPQDDGSLGSVQEFKDHHNNTLAIKHLKNLREKIKHAIKESKKERHRIIMDAILHKVPSGHRHPKDVKEDTHMRTGTGTEKCIQYSPGSSSRSDQYFAFGNSELQRIKRTSSFNESFDRYNRLLQLCFNREANNGMSDNSKLRTTGTPSPVGTRPLLGRILSLPDLRSYSFSRIEVSQGHYSSETPIRPVLPGTLSIGSSRFGDEKLTGSENQIQLYDASSESGSRENLLEDGDTFNDSSRLEGRDGTPHHDSITKPVHVMDSVEDTVASGTAKFSAAKDLEVIASNSSILSEDSLVNQKNVLGIDSPVFLEKNIITSKEETPIKQSYSDLLHFQVDTINNAEFNYVRDILELSGFCGNELLGKWHSAEQPVDPSVYEEVETHPEYLVDEESGSSNHLLLFDLINEVLLDIYEKSFSYWPMPLTCRSHVHRLPVGYHVLEDVWTNIRWYLNSMSEIDQPLDDAVTRDLAKRDGWMNIQFESECVGLELEDMIFDDLLDELVFT